MTIYAPSDWQEPDSDTAPEYTAYRINADVLALWFLLHPGESDPPGDYIENLYRAQQAWQNAKAAMR